MNREDKMVALAVQSIVLACFGLLFMLNPVLSGHMVDGVNVVYVLGIILVVAGAGFAAIIPFVKDDLKTEDDE